MRCIALYFGCSLCAAGGVGGDDINVPILIGIFGYRFTYSRKLSLIVVLGNAFAQSCINTFSHHPTLKNRPLIFWELVAILLPYQMGGYNIGSILAEIVPTSYLYILSL